MKKIDILKDINERGQNYADTILAQKLNEIVDWINKQEKV